MNDQATKRTPEGGPAGPSAASSPASGGPARGTAYRITVKGEIDDRWTGWFEGMTISHTDAGDSVLAGTVRDQTALHGLIARIRDLGLTLLAVEPRPLDSGAAELGRGGRSPVPAIVGSILAGLALAGAFVLGPASAGSEATVTGSILLAFGLGWGLMAAATTRFSSQPQAWMSVPAAVLGLTGLGLLVTQPGAEAMDVLGWIWPPVIAILGIWSIRRALSTIRGHGRWLVVPLAAVLVAASVGGGLTTLGSVAGRGEMPRSGELVDVGGHRLHLECHGSGSPVVVLQIGLSGSAADWSRIAPTVAESTTVCAYDRAGHGWSDPAPGPQDGIAIAADLHALLERAGVAGPYVLVGHSSGGPYTRVFADRYPDDVAGMVLLDAQPADAFTALPAYPGFYRVYGAVMTIAPTLARLGPGFLLGSPADPTGIRMARSTHDELIALPAALQQAQALTTIGDRPLVVLSAGTGTQEGWGPAQVRLVGLSTNAVHRVLASATHESLVVGADAGASSRAILDVLAAARTGSPVR